MGLFSDLRRDAELPGARTQARTMPRAPRSTTTWDTGRTTVQAQPRSVILIVKHLRPTILFHLLVHMYAMKSFVNGSAFLPLRRCLFAGILLLPTGLAWGQQMAVTFDDLPVHGALPPGMTRLEIAQSILATLKRERMPPVYGFINGGRGEDDPSSLSVLQNWRGAGQPLGNHTWAHLDLNKESAEEFGAEVLKNEPLLESLMKTADWHWLRYPFLHEGDTVEKRRAVRAWAFANGYKIAEVSMDFEDYLWNEPYARCMAKHDDASIQKLHDTYLAVAVQYYDVSRELSKLVYGRDVKYVLLMHVGAFDARMLPELLELYRAKGVRFISLPEANLDPAYRDDPDIGEASGGTLLELMMQKKQLKFPPNSKPYKELEAMCR
jgi:peptidoglycan/xylan/chitin deacetylase (PgdA/CDA1 family)